MSLWGFCYIQKQSWNVKVKGKVVQYLSTPYAGMCENGGSKAPCILNFGSELAWMVNVTLQLLCPWCLDDRVSGTYWLGGWFCFSQSGCGSKRKVLTKNRTLVIQPITGQFTDWAIPYFKIGMCKFVCVGVCKCKMFVIKPLSFRLILHL
jgi:hypothetical protein